MIVKVQLPPSTTDPEARAFAYPEGKPWARFLRITPELRHAMCGRAKAYFYAELRGTELHLLEDAGRQSW